MTRSFSSVRTRMGRGLCIPSSVTQKLFTQGLTIDTCRSYWRGDCDVCKSACAGLGSVYPDRVAVVTKRWFVHALCRSKSGFGALTCGAFSNWIWQLRTHCSLRRRVAGSLAEPPLIQPIPFPNGMVQSCPRTFQTVRHGGEDRLENWEPSATTLNVD